MSSSVQALEHLPDRGGEGRTGGLRGRGASQGIAGGDPELPGTISGLDCGEGVFY